MIHVYLGTDRGRARAKMNAAIERAAQQIRIVRITDAHTTEDLTAALESGGLFREKRVLVFEGLSAHPDLGVLFLDLLERLSQSSDEIFIFEEKPLADIRKKLEKYAEDVQKFDASKQERDTSIFVLSNALRRGDKKALWVSYVREIAKGTAPEAIHGVLFWAAKDAYVKSNGTKLREKELVAFLAELPHEARRRGEDLEYALERFVLSER